MPPLGSSMPAVGQERASERGCGVVRGEGDLMGGRYSGLHAGAKCASIGREVVHGRQKKQAGLTEAPGIGGLAQDAVAQQLRRHVRHCMETGNGARVAGWSMGKAARSTTDPTRCTATGTHECWTAAWMCSYARGTPRQISSTPTPAFTTHLCQSCCYATRTCRRCTLPAQSRRPVMRDRFAIFVPKPHKAVMITSDNGRV